MLVISNRPRASRSSDFEITRAITPWIVLRSVQLLLLIIIIIINNNIIITVIIHITYSTLSDITCDTAIYISYSNLQVFNVID